MRVVHPIVAKRRFRERIIYNVPALTDECSFSFVNPLLTLNAVSRSSIGTYYFGALRGCKVTAMTSKNPREEQKNVYLPRITAVRGA